jgi:F-type H+-transporting ATPase subunit gamma
MPSTRDIRRRIKSVKNTAQITKAMQMVASTKMRKAQNRAISSRPYAEQLDRVASHINSQAVGVDHPLLEERPVRRRCVLVISTDRGLCGALNTNLFREISHQDTEDTVYVTVGRKGRQFVPRLRKSGGGGKANLLADFELKDIFTFGESKRITQFLIDKFLAGEIDRVDVAYNRFVNALVQQPVIVPLLPIGRHFESKAGETVAQAPVSAAAPASAPGEAGAIYLSEPPAQQLLGLFLPFVVHFEVYHHILDARASEHSARMVAMKNATENAKDLVKALTLEYNKARQSAITTELLEITTAQLAVG